MPKNVCSFCGRSESEVKLLITGIKGYICENCAKQAYDIVLSSGVLNDKKNDKFAFKEVPKPCLLYIFPIPQNGLLSRIHSSSKQKEQRKSCNNFVHPT